MSFSSSFVRNVTYPLWKFKDGSLGELKYRSAYAGLGQKTLKEINDSQLVDLQAMLVWTTKHSAYYRDLYKRVGFEVGEVFDYESFSKIPLLNKDIVRAESDRIQCVDECLGKISPASTGGSSGTPMKFTRDENCIYRRIAQDRYFDHEFLDFRVGDKMAYFVSASHFYSASHRWKAALRNATCERMLKFDPSKIDDAYMADFAQKFIKFKPKVIKCFPNSLTIFAKYVDENNIQLPPVKAISCTGETLYPKQRELFEKVFRGRVYEKYGSIECGVAASECAEHDGMHIFTPGVFLELVDKNLQPVAPGEMGRIVLTDLFNRSFPLIRYEIGDMGVAEEAAVAGCPCGNKLPKIKKILGRDRDILFDMSGNPKPGYLFVDVINKLNLDAQFQVYQHADKRVRLKIAKKELSTETIAKIHERYIALLGETADIQVEFVDLIERDPSGKYRYVKNEVGLLDGMN